MGAGHKKPEEKAVQAETSDVQLAAFSILHESGRKYSQRVSNEIIRLADAQNSGKNVKLEPNNPLHSVIRPEDLESTRQFLRNKSASADAIAEFSIKGPEKTLAEATPKQEAKEKAVAQAPVQGFAYKVTIGSKEYAISMNPIGISAPVSGKENERKEQMKKALSDSSLVISVTVRNVVSGEDVTIGANAFLSTFLKAMSENPEGVKVYPPRRV